MRAAEPHRQVAARRSGAGVAPRQPPTLFNLDIGIIDRLNAPAQSAIGALNAELARSDAERRSLREALGDAYRAALQARADCEKIRLDAAAEVAKQSASALAAIQQVVANFTSAHERHEKQASDKLAEVALAALDVKDKKR
jgi:hypothetical protein